MFIFSWLRFSGFWLQLSEEIKILLDSLEGLKDWLITSFFRKSGRYLSEALCEGVGAISAGLWTVDRRWVVASRSATRALMSTLSLWSTGQRGSQVWLLILDRSLNCWVLYAEGWGTLRGVSLARISSGLHPAKKRGTSTSFKMLNKEPCMYSSKKKYSKQAPLKKRPTKTTFDAGTLPYVATSQQRIW